MKLTTLAIGIGIGYVLAKSMSNGGMTNGVAGLGAILPRRPHRPHPGITSIGPGGYPAPGGLPPGPQCCRPAGWGSCPAGSVMVD